MCISRSCSQVQEVFDEVEDKSLTVQCYLALKLIIFSIINKLEILMQRNRTIETSLSLFGYISSFSLPVVFHPACSRYIFIFLFFFLSSGNGTEFRRTMSVEDSM